MPDEIVGHVEDPWLIAAFCPPKPAVPLLLLDSLRELPTFFGRTAYAMSRSLISGAPWKYFLTGHRTI
jgi:hypothetical protein